MVEIDPGRDYYEILGVGLGATPTEIRDAYRDLAKQHHPDTGHGDVDRFRLIQEAYQVLYDATYRRAYDRQRLSRGYGTGSLAFTLLLSQRELRPMDTPQMFYLIADIHPQDVPRGAPKKLNLALVIDRSTSMQGARMHNVKVAANDLVDSLNPSDRLAIVAFGDRAEVVTTADLSAGWHHFRSAISSIVPGGGTEIYQGLRQAIGLVKPHVAADTVSHIILMTDGRTYGDEELALAAADDAAESGIGISAFGIGDDWDDAFLDRLAQAGGGISDYIDAPAKVQQALRSQIRGLANTAMTRVRLGVSTTSSARLVGAYRVAPYMDIFPVRDDCSLDLGNLSIGEAASVAMEFTVQRNEVGAHRIARLVVEGDDVGGGKTVGFWRDVDVTFTDHPESALVPLRLLTTLARLSVFRLQERAWNALEAGDPETATQYLQSAATRLFDMGYKELGQAAMLEVNRLARGTSPSESGRKQLRYGTRALSIRSS